MPYFAVVKRGNMAQEPAPPPPSGQPGPGFFQSVNGAIAGITGLVIALGSLAAAWNSFSAKEEEQQQVAGGQEEAGNGAEAEASDTATEEEAATVKAAMYSGNLYADGEYGGDALTLEDKDDHWLLTVGEDDPVEYEEVKSPYADWVMAYDKEEEKYLLWPMVGGEMQKGNKKKENWSKFARVEPEEPAAEEPAEEPAQAE